MKKLILIVLFSYNCFALVGDEVCQEFAIVKAQVICFKNCNGNNFPTNREVCLKWGPSPSAKRAELIGNKIKEKLAPELTSLNKVTHQEIMKDVNKALEKLDSSNASFVKSLETILNKKD